MPRLLTIREVAAQLQVSLSTLRGWRKQGKGPPVVQLGPSTFRYTEEEVQKFINGKTAQTYSRP